MITTEHIHDMIQNSPASTVELSNILEILDVMNKHLATLEGRQRAIDNIASRLADSIQQELSSLRNAPCISAVKPPTITTVYCRTGIAGYASTPWLTSR